MRDRRGAESAGASANSRSRRKRPYVSGATTVRFEAVYKFVIMVALPVSRTLCAPIQKSAHTILTLYSLIVRGVHFLYINLDGAPVPISPYPVPFLCTTFYCILGSRYSTQSMQNWEYWRQWSYFETWHGHFQDKASIYHFIYNPCFICYKSSTVVWSICMDWPNLRIPPSLVSLVKIKRY